MKLRNLFFALALIISATINPISAQNWFVESQNKVNFFSVPSGVAIKPERNTANLTPALLFGASKDINEKFGISTFAIVGQKFGKGYLLGTWSPSVFKFSFGLGMQNHEKNPLSTKASIFYKSQKGWQGFFTWEQSLADAKNHFYQGYFESPLIPEADGDAYVRLGIHAQYNILVGPRMSGQLSKCLKLWVAGGWNIENGGQGLILALNTSF